MATPALKLVADDRRTARPIVGDLVRSGTNLYPHYHVIAISGDRAWVRDSQYNTDHIVPFARCHLV